MIRPLAFFNVTNRPERLFLVAAIVYGTLFVIIVPPLHGGTFDETKHFFRAYQVSELTLLSTTMGYPPEDAGGYLPKSLPLLRQFRYGLSVGPPRTKLDVSDLMDLASVKLNPDDREFHTFKNTSRYTFVPYVPPALGIAVGRMFGFPPVILMYLGRWTSLLAWALLTYYAVKSAPFSKPVFLLLALTPLSQAAALSADALTNAVAFLLIAQVLKCAYGPTRQLTARDLAGLCAMTVLLLLCKQGYLPLCFLVLLVAPQRFGSTRRYVCFLMCYMLAVCCIAGIGWLNAKHVWVPIFNIDVGPRALLANVLTHPVGFSRAVLATVLRHCFVVDVWNWPQSFIGIHIHRGLLIPWWLVVTYYAVLALATIFDAPRPESITIPARFFMLLLFFGSTLCLFLLAYVGWHGLRMPPLIWGVQARYFIPFVLLVFLPVSFGLARTKALRSVVNLSVSCLILTTLSFATVLQVRVDYMPEDNLIDNDTFAVWSDVSGLPAGWSMDASADSSPVATVIERVQDIELTDGAGVRQVWLSADWRLPASQCFGVTVSGLEPGSLYRFYASGKISPDLDPSFRIQVFEMHDAGTRPEREAVFLRATMASVPRGNFGQRYMHERLFQAGETGVVRIVSVCHRDEDIERQSIVWDEWAMTRLP